MAGEAPEGEPRERLGPERCGRQERGGEKQDRSDRIGHGAPKGTVEGKPRPSGSVGLGLGYRGRTTHGGTVGEPSRRHTA
jgi:hypothetical protein